VDYIIPPLFNDVKKKLSKEIEDFINKLKISAKEKIEVTIQLPDLDFLLF